MPKGRHISPKERQKIIENLDINIKVLEWNTKNEANKLRTKKIG